ncbi:MAG: toxin-antitoxin system HicB family antitoxin [Pirellulaceae bacterium]
MAKRKTTARKTSTKSPPEPEILEDASADLRVRVDADIHRKVKNMAEQCGISINQLVAGIIEGVADRMQPGLPRISGEVVNVESRSKCLFIGKPGRRFTETDYEFRLENHDQIGGKTPSREEIGTILDKGEVWFVLDYSGRPVRYTAEEY